MNAVRSEDGAETARLELPASRRRASRSQDGAIPVSNVRNQPARDPIERALEVQRFFL